MVKFVPFNPTDKITIAFTKDNKTGEIMRVMKGAPQVRAVAGASACRHGSGGSCWLAASAAPRRATTKSAGRNQSPHFPTSQFPRPPDSRAPRRTPRRWWSARLTTAPTSRTPAPPRSRSMRCAASAASASPSALETALVRAALRCLAVGFGCGRGVDGCSASRLRGSVVSARQGIGTHSYLPACPPPRERAQRTAPTAPSGSWSAWCPCLTPPATIPRRPSSTATP